MALQQSICAHDLRAMNYRHAFHAGNFADVLKHAVLTRILVHLRRKPTPFRVIDIHAGAGRYDLTAEEAQRSGERRDGIARLEAASLRAPARTLLAPYIDAVAACNPTGPTDHLSRFAVARVRVAARKIGLLPASLSRAPRRDLPGISQETGAARR
jgi:23S rRNA A2030 N6-methylase RlmJ